MVTVNTYFFSDTEPHEVMSVKAECLTPECLTHLVIRRANIEYGMYHAEGGVTLTNVTSGPSFLIFTISRTIRIEEIM